MTPPASLVRAIGRWSLTALVINSIIGSGIFGLPAIVAGYLGRASPLAYMLASAAVGLVIGCFAEVGSQFREAGGPYLYTRAAFGRFLGLQVAWLHWLVRLTAGAAGVNLFVTYLAFFWPAGQNLAARAIISAALIGFIAAINVLGVKTGAHMSSIFTVAKLVPLLIFCFAGLAFIRLHGSVPAAPHAPVSVGNWFEAALVLIFAYGGFEGAVVPMSEARDPHRDVPFALGAALLTVTLVYALVQFVVVRLLSDPSQTDRPLALAAQVSLGPAGAWFMALAALVALYGYLSAQMVHTPRLTFALAERGDFPRLFAAIHSCFRTPYISIIVYAALLWTVTTVGNFRWNVLLSSVARLFTYSLVCAALLILRRKPLPNTPKPLSCHSERSEESLFASPYRLPAGSILAVIAIVLMVALASRSGLGELEVIAATAAIAFLNWLAASRLKLSSERSMQGRF